jgi:Fe-S oxidoreductase
VFREIKNLFDPHNLLNPGKIITSDPHQTQRHLRPRIQPPGDDAHCQLRWEPLEVLETASRCNGCGVCKTQEPEQRMCPFFRIDSLEDASPRAKANVLRNLGGQLTMDDFRSPEMKRLAGLCFNCKQCELECPANVNIPQLMIEAKASYVAMNGLSRADWILSRAHSFGALASSFSWLSNWAIGNPAARWLIEKVIGIAKQRKLPRFARRTFLRSAQRRLTQPPDRSQRPRPVIYFVDHFANYHDTQLARAFVAILDHNSIPVHVPLNQTASGMAMVSAGDLDAARDVAEQNVRVLADFARDGYDIVCTEPAAALCLSKEYPMLIDHPDVPVIARQVMDAGEYLLKAHEEGRLQTDFTALDLDVAYHTPCHLKSLSPRLPLFRLLSLIPELRVHTIDKGCSGMAGAYGLVRENFRTSIRIGWGLIAAMREDGLDAGVTECSSCKLQMEQGTVTPTVHPLKLLALSYGLMPEIQEMLKPVPRRLVTS